MATADIEKRPAARDAATGTAPSPDAPAESWGWTRRQRIGLGVMLAVLLVFLTIQFLRRPWRLDDPVVTVGGTPVALPQRIDPNTASLEELARIPHIGEKLAGAIVEWRDKRRGVAADGIVFHRPEDLDGVPGIGAKRVAELAPFLRFPDDTDGRMPTDATYPGPGETLIPPQK